MKIEFINDNQIRCILNRSDLASHHIRMSELVYGTEKTKRLFQDMMDQAADQFGFDANDIPLIIEAIPVSMDCIILMITKVDSEDGEIPATDVPDLQDMLSDDYESESDADIPVPDSDEPHTPYGDHLTPAERLLRAIMEPDEPADNAPAKPAPVPDKLKGAPIERMYSFTELEDVIALSRTAGAYFNGKSSLYKSPEDGKYYLILEKSACGFDEFSKICRAALEYGSKEPFGYARGAFVREHFDLLVKNNAVQSLAGV